MQVAVGLNGLQYRRTEEILVILKTITKFYVEFELLNLISDFLALV